MVGVGFLMRADQSTMVGPQPVRRIELLAAFNDGFF